VLTAMIMPKSPILYLLHGPIWLLVYDAYGATEIALLIWMLWQWPEYVTNGYAFCTCTPRDMHINGQGIPGATKC